MRTEKILIGLMLIIGLASTLTAQGLVINEFMADNGELTEIVDEAGQADDWIEIHNTSDESIDISGYFLSDKLDDLQKWEVPSGFSIGPVGYKIIWADDDASQGPLHTTFKLSKSGESIYLSDPTGEIVDSITYGEQTTNISYARIPNGTGNFEFKAPTFQYNNEATSSIDTPENKAAFSIYPNPASTSFAIDWEEKGAVELLNISIWDALGNLVHSQKVKRAGNQTVTTLSLQKYISGVYYVQLETTSYHSIEILVVE
ncbi:MAG: lamin tail domain-containing protein [Saprospiraceae bacterium]